MVKLVATLSSYGRRAVVVGGVADRYAGEFVERVSRTDNAQELEALRRSVQRGRPFGQPEWQKEIAKRPGLE